MGNRRGQGKAYSFACQEQNSRLESKQANKRVASWRLVGSTLGIWTPGKSNEGQHPRAMCQMIRAERSLKRETLRSNHELVLPCKGSSRPPGGHGCGEGEPVSPLQPQVNSQQPALTPRAAARWVRYTCLCGFSTASRVTPAHR